MKLQIRTCLIAALPLAAQVRFTSSAGGVKVDIDGKPFTEFHAGTEVGKPFLAPLRWGEGKS